MGTQRTAWHVPFAALLTERAPPGIDVQVEVPLSFEPQRADVLLLRKPAVSLALDQARVLRGLWPLLGTDTLVDFKSVSRPLRRGDLVRLVGYGAQYHVRHIERLVRQQLTLVLVVTDRTPTLQQELSLLGWTVHEVGSGYAWLEGGMYPALLVGIDEVAEAERDDLLARFGHPKVPSSLESLWWWQQHIVRTAVEVQMEQLEGYEEVVKAFFAALPKQMVPQVLSSLTPEQRLAGLPPEQRLAGLPPEQRLAGLTPEQLDELYKVLSERRGKSGA
jgi:hypothetical protein